MESGFRNPGKFFLWNPESWALKSGIQLKESGIPLMTGIQSPRFIDKDWNPVPGIRNPQRGIQNPSRLSWIPLPGAMIIDRGNQGLRLRLMPLSPARPLRLSVAPHSALGSAWDNI